MGSNDGSVTTPFEGMSHEQMRSWLSTLNGAAVLGVADRLQEASGAIREIADDLKTHMADVNWSGTGADAFIAWGTNMANSTARLGNYALAAGIRLQFTSETMTEVQSAMPETLTAAEANRDAAASYHNDPDAQAIIRSSGAAATELGQEGAAGEAARESARQDAIQQMRKLADQYAFTAMQMDNEEVPVFPAPPGEFAPDAEKSLGVLPDYGGSSNVNISGSSGGTGLSAATTTGTSHAVAASSVSQQDLALRGVGAVGGTTSSPVSLPLYTPTPAYVAETPVTLEIDNATVLPQSPSVPAAPAGGVSGLPSGGRSDGGVLPQSGSSLPLAFGGYSGSTGSGGGTMRPPQSGGVSVPPGRVGSTGVGGAARPTGQGGIVGGRPITPTTGRLGSIPRGTVIGAEGSNGRSGMMPGTGAGAAGGRGSQSGVTGGRRLAQEPGGVVGRPIQRPGSSGDRPFTPGGSGLAGGSSGQRNGGVGGSAVRGGAIPPGNLSGTSQQRQGDRRRRPDYLSEDEETWQPNGRPRTTPPVVD